MNPSALRGQPDPHAAGCPYQQQGLPEELQTPQAFHPRPPPHPQHHQYPHPAATHLYQSDHRQLLSPHYQSTPRAQPHSYPSVGGPAWMPMTNLGQDSPCRHHDPGHMGVPSPSARAVHQELSSPRYSPDGHGMQSRPRGCMNRPDPEYFQASYRTNARSQNRIVDPLTTQRRDQQQVFNQSSPRYRVARSPARSVSQYSDCTTPRKRSGSMPVGRREASLEEETGMRRIGAALSIIAAKAAARFRRSERRSSAHYGRHERSMEAAVSHYRVDTALCLPASHTHVPLVGEYPPPKENAHSPRYGWDAIHRAESVSTTADGSAPSQPNSVRDEDSRRQSRTPLSDRNGELSRSPSTASSRGVAPRSHSAITRLREEQLCELLMHSPGLLNDMYEASLLEPIPVVLRVYDISEGKAAKYSDFFLKRHVEGVWHSGVYVFGYEYFYGDGVLRMRPQDVEQGYAMTLTYTHCLGETRVPQYLFERFLQCIAPAFGPDKYDLVNWNCNHFTNFCAEFLVDESIPSYIIDQPEEILKTQVGRFVVFMMRLSNGRVKPEDVFGPNVVAAASKVKQRFLAARC